MQRSGETDVQPDSDEGGARPVRFGDVVLLSDGSLGIVYLPDQGRELLACFELDELGNLPEAEWEHETVIASRDSIARVVRSHADLPTGMRRRLEPYRRGIMLGGSHWSQGVELLGEREQISFQNGLWEELNTDACELVTALFGPLAPGPGENADAACYRVLIHLDEAWDTWRCFGPMTHRESRSLLEDLPCRFAPPRELRRGVYQASADAMSKFEVYRHYTKIEERRFTRGQGEV